GSHMKGFNLSDWALNHRSLVWYFMLVFVAAGVSQGSKVQPPMPERIVPEVLMDFSSNMFCRQGIALVN
ncbi:hypothetical protein, partial [Mesorhizobium sp. M2D.F.Ca.ET.140.01.1.1]|uniref:hypothetical protein n=1 Tax=Mesorhizobium sp. M2D.F.Ca.ET.140.01.1.1 TaxID=2496664 RepID=UPI001AECA60A